MTDFFIFNNVIGVIDSGSGGVNVIKECLKYYNEEFIYLVDNKNCPYGNKPPEELKKILANNIEYLIKNFDLDFIIIACNTISAFVDYKTMQNYKTPILKTVPQVTNNGNDFLIFATKGTINNSKDLRLFKLNYPKLKTLYIKDLPKLIDEKLSKNTPEIEENLKKTLKNAYFFKNKLKKRYKNIKYISLGCTHFKYIENMICNIFNNKISIFHCEENVARVSRWLIRKNKKESSFKIILTREDENFYNKIIKLLT